MSQQNKKYTHKEHGKILDLEMKYMNVLSSMITSDDFKNDLKKMEESIKNDYTHLIHLWNKKNKIKEASERLVRHHVYQSLDNIIGFYPYPVSSDIALELEDVIINIDIKTIDIQENKGELKSVQFEHNQISFENKPLYDDEFVGIKSHASLPTQDEETEKYVLSYLIKIGYFDNGKDTFYLVNEKKLPSVVLVCIPNGKLSYLFDRDLVINFKTYKYYSEAENDYFKPKFISKKKDYNSRCEADKYAFLRRKANIPSDWKNIKIKTTRSKRLGFFDKNKEIVWIEYSQDSKSEIYLKAVKSGNTGRLKPEWLRDRFDSCGNKWEGIRNFFELYK